MLAMPVSHLRELSDEVGKLMEEEAKQVPTVHG